MSERGFIQFIKDAVIKYGEKAIWKWFEKWGYDQEMYNTECKCVMVSIHSDKQIEVSLEENSLNTRDFDMIITRQLLRTQGRECSKKDGFFRVMENYYE